MGLGQPPGDRRVRRGCGARRLLHRALGEAPGARRRPLAAAHPRVRAVQLGHAGDGRRLLRIHAVQRPVPDHCLALLDTAGRARPDARPDRRDPRRRARQPSGRTHRASCRAGAGRTDLGRRRDLLRQDAGSGAGLPRRVAAGHGDPRARRWTHLSDAQWRRRRLGAGPPLRDRDGAQLRGAAGRRGAGGRRADRDHREPVARLAAARLPARLAVRGRLLRGRLDRLRRARPRA